MHSSSAQQHAAFTIAAAGTTVDPATTATTVSRCKSKGWVSNLCATSYFKPQHATMHTISMLPVSKLLLWKRGQSRVPDSFNLSKGQSNG
jgi:hypothetical protein